MWSDCSETQDNHLAWGIRTNKSSEMQFPKGCGGWFGRLGLFEEISALMTFLSPWSMLLSLFSRLDKGTLERVAMRETEGEAPQ